MKGKSTREAVAALGVIASLVFVGYEIRQNTTVARAAAYQEIGFNVLETWRQIAHDPDLASLLVLTADSARWEEIDPVGRLQLVAVDVGQMRAWEAIYRQVNEGLLPDDAITQFGYGTGMSAWSRHIWPSVKRRIPPDFAEFVERHYRLN